MRFVLTRDDVKSHTETMTFYYDCVCCCYQCIATEQHKKTTTSWLNFALLTKQNKVNFGTQAHAKKCFSR